MVAKGNRYVWQGAILLIALTGGGCDHDIAWTHSHPLPEDGWKSGQSICFDLDPQAYELKEARSKFAEATARAVGDTVPRLHGDFDATLSLRYTEHCNASEVSVVVERASLVGEISTDTLTFHLFDSTGKTLGSGRYGVYERSLPLPRPLRVDEGTQINVSPLPYATSPAGLNAVILTLRNYP